MKVQIYILSSIKKQKLCFKCVKILIVVYVKKIYLCSQIYNFFILSMNITRTNKEELVDTIAVQLETADYTPSFDKNLKTFAKKVNLPGFRPGMVPLSIVKKRFGKDILGEELIKIANQNLMEYVREHKVLYFGRPVLMDTPEELKPETEDKYTFSFDIGLLPEIDIVLSADKTFYQYNVEITEEVIEQELKWIAK